MGQEGTECLVQSPKPACGELSQPARAATRWGTEQNLICDHLQPAVMEHDRQLLLGWWQGLWGQLCVLGLQEDRAVRERASPTHPYTSYTHSYLTPHTPSLPAYDFAPWWPGGLVSLSLSVAVAARPSVACLYQRPEPLPGRLAVLSQDGLFLCILD